MTSYRKLLRSVIITGFAAIASLAAAQQYGANPPTMGTGQTTPSGISKDMKGQMTPDQVREYLDARNKCGAPSAQTQACIDDVHKKYTQVDPKCRTLYGPALTDCMQAMAKRG